ncbi:C-type lectin lectoxin-Thr1-like isoform 1-T1 [Pangshura tecta]
MGPVAYFSLCLLGCLIFNPPLAGVQAVSCPRCWLPFQDSCYRYIAQEKTWREAEDECKQHWTGAHLASIHSAEERNMLVHYIKPEPTKQTHVWIGLSDPEHALNWKWTDHSPFTFRAWDKGQPNNLTGNEHCVVLFYPTGFQKWHDYPCTDRHAFICKGKPWGRQLACTWGLPTSGL